MVERQTERKATKVALAAATREWRATFDAIREPVCLLDLEGTILRGNKANAEFVRRTPREVVGHNCCTLVHEHSDRPPECPLIRMLKTQAHEEAEFMLNDRWVRVAVDPVFDENGVLTGAVHTLSDFTEHWRADRALRESEERYHRLLASVTDYVYTVEIGDEHGITTTHGPGCVAVTGYSPEDYAADPHLWYRMVYDEDKQAVAQHATSIMVGEEVHPIEHRIVHRNGSVRWVRNTPVQRFDDQRRLVGYDALVSDITERKHAEAHVLNQARVLDAINTVFRESLTCDTSEEVAHCCLSVALHLTGSELGIVGEVNESGRMDTIAQSDTGWAACRIPKTQAIKMLTNMELRGFLGAAALQGRPVLVNDPTSHPDRVGAPEGHPTITSFLGVPLKRAGIVIGMIGLANKGTGFSELDQRNVEALSVAFVEALDRKRAEEALRESEAKYRTLFEASTDAIFLETLDGRVLDCNSAACTLFGYSKEALLELSVTDLVPEETRASLPAVVRELSTNGSVFLEASNVASCGRVFPCEVSLRLVTVGGKPRVIAYVRDISQRKWHEEEIRLLNARLGQRNAELEAANLELEAFAFSVSHDLHTPLLLIGGFARLLQEECATQLAPEPSRYLRLIVDNAQRMGQLIDDLLAFSRLGHQPLKTRTVTPTEIVREVADNFLAERQGRKIELTIGELPPCQADPVLLKQVFVNLLSNALKFTRRRDVARIEVGCRDEGGETVFFVKDNGVGFDMRHAEEVFGVFTRLHQAEEYEGRGVGLANVQRIVQKHGGRIWAETEVDRGATFFFTLGEMGPQ